MKSAGAEESFGASGRVRLPSREASKMNRLFER